MSSITPSLRAGDTVTSLASARAGLSEYAVVVEAIIVGAADSVDEAVIDPADVAADSPEVADTLLLGLALETAELTSEAAADEASPPPSPPPDPACPPISAPC